MLSMGIVGLPNVGKSTLFQALTQKQVDTSNYPFATIDPNVGVVAVPDERLEKLASLSHSKEIIHAIVEFVDIAGLVKDASKGEGLGNKFLANIREVDTICHVVRAFENENISHVSGRPDPESDLAIIKTELLIKDLETIVKIREKALKETKTGRKEDLAFYNKIVNLERHLEKETLEEVSGDLMDMAKQYQLLSFKPYLVVFNISNKKNISTPNIPNSISIDAEQERDINSLSTKDQQELGFSSKLSELIQEAYDLLGLITFFTTGEVETRAWTIPKGSTAKRAGRAIHSDFEEKFIRADVIAWDKLIEAESRANARDKGWLRTEGKDYIVQDGDVIEFRI